MTIMFSTHFKLQKNESIMNIFLDSDNTISNKLILKYFED